MKLALCDSFKGSLSQEQICSILRRFGYYALAISDGGEGFVSCINSFLDANKIPFYAPNALNEGNHCGYYLKKGALCVLEMAEHCGIAKLGALRDILKASSASFGLALKDASKQASLCVAGIGGSASNDAGMGILSAFGWQFFDAFNNPLKPSAASLLACSKAIAGDSLLDDIYQSDYLQLLDDLLNNRPIKAPSKCAILVANDVRAPLYGELGCARVFAAQKGANASLIGQLDEAAKRFVLICAQALAHKYHLNSNKAAALCTQLALKAGAGAAGGCGFGLLLLGARMHEGFKLFSALSGWQSLDFSEIAVCEGAFDKQSLMGKPAGEALKFAASKNIAAKIICAKSSMQASELSQQLGINVQIWPISSVFAHLSLAEQFKQASSLLAKTMHACSIYEVLRLAFLELERLYFPKNPALSFAKCFYSNASRFSEANIHYIAENKRILAAACAYKIAPNIDKLSAKLTGGQFTLEADLGEFYLDCIAVIPQARKKGYFKQLLNELEIKAKSQGCTRLIALSKDAGLYEHAGFSCIGAKKLGSEKYFKLLKRLN